MYPTDKTFNEWYTKEIQILLDKLRMRKDGGRTAAKLIWEAAQRNTPMCPGCK